MQKKKIILFLLIISCFFSLKSQEITNVNPNEGTKGETLNVTISGLNTHFGQGTSTTQVWFQQGSGTIINSYEVDINSPNNLDAEITIPFYVNTGNYDVFVYNNLDGLLELEDGFFVNPNPNEPHLLSISPDEAVQGETLNVTISGLNTYFGQGTSTTQVWFQQGTETVISSYEINVNNSNNLEAEITIPEDLEADCYDLYTYNSIVGELVLEESFCIDCNIEIDFDYTISGGNVIFNTMSDYNLSYIDWNFQGEPVVSTGSNQETLMLSYDEIGVYEITLFAENGECSQSITKQINITSIYPISIENLDNVEIKLYPNPSENFIFIETKNKNMNMEIIDIKGNIIFSKKNLENFNKIDISYFLSGTYFVKIKSNNFEKVKKIIIK